MSLRYLRDGDIVTLRIPHSEAAMAAQIAGDVRMVIFCNEQTVPYSRVKWDDGTWSAPYTTGEMGILYDAHNKQHYCYVNGD